jgi:hypothetical protein
MAVRWATRRSTGQLRPTSIFARFAGRLRTMHAKCDLEASYQIDRAEPLFRHTSTSPHNSIRHWYSPHDLVTCLEQSRPEINLMSNTQDKIPRAHGNVQPHEDSLINCDASVFQEQVEIPWCAMEVDPLEDGNQEDEVLLAISQSLLNPDFMSMDRIISFEDMMAGNISEAWDFS